MSEGTFRAVVASVLVCAFALAVVIAGGVLLPRSPSSTPGASIVTSASLLPTPSPALTHSPGPAFKASVIGVGQIPGGGTSGNTLVLQFLETSIAAIPSAAGSFRVTLTDDAGDGTTVGFAGMPLVEAPGSLGASVTRIASNVLLVSILGADPNNVELLSIRGLGINASKTAALGALKAQLDGFSGSLAAGAGDMLVTPGTVVPSP